MPTYQLISSVTVGAGGASSIDFTSIPATYTDLVILASTRNDAATAAMLITLNNSATSYTNKRLYGDGTNASSDSYSTTNLDAAGGAGASTYTANTFSNFSLYIPNYAGSTNKSMSSDTAAENNSTANYMGLYASLWSNTAAINQITLKPGSGNFVQYSSAYLYGIKNS